MLGSRVAEAAQKHKKPVWTRAKILSSYIYAILPRYKDLSQFTHFVEDFGQKKCCFFVKKKTFLGKEVLYYTV